MNDRTVLYARVDDATYPRNVRIRDYVEAEGFRVRVHLRSTRGGRLSRAIQDLRSMIRDSRNVGTIVVSEFSLPYAAFAWILARRRRARLVVDGFVGKHETVIEDWKRHSRRSLAALWCRLVDHVALSLSDLYLIDTEVRAEGLRRSRGIRRSILALPVGAPAWAQWHDVPDRPGDGGLTLLYYGADLPLHGLPVVLRALAKVDDPTVTLTLVGGDRLAAAKRLASELGIAERCTFRELMNTRDLAQTIRDHDVVLGIFGDSPKARGVIANKVWQGLAAGRTVITKRTPASDELVPIAGSHLVCVDDETDLSNAITSLRARRPSAADPSITLALESHVHERFARLGDWLNPERSMTVVHAIDTLAVGGAQRVLMELAGWTAEQGVRSVIVAQAGPLSVGDDPQVSFERVSGSSFVTYLMTLDRVCRSARPHVLHAHQRREALACYLVGWMRRIPAVEHAHTVLPSRRWRRLSFRSDTVFAVGTAVAGMVVDDFKRPPHSVQAIGNPVPSATALAGAATRRNRDAGEPLRLIGIGRLEAQKDPLRFVSLVAACARITPVTGIWFGTGPLLAEASEHAAEQGAPVRFAGHSGQIASEMDSADALILTSRWEGTPLVVLEAFARRLPVIAYDAPGVTELIAGGRGVRLGTLAPSEAAGVIVAALSERDSEATASVTATAAAYAAADCSPEHVFGPVLARYRELAHAQLSNRKVVLR